ncbi:MAG: hypothetical protein IPJ65_01180 [Archangiaceae bacterium]|nr:hypothetical protein [Archangiaceae bacterium]
MKRALVLSLALAACDDWNALEQNASCRVRGCDAGSAGGAAGGSAGGGAAGGITAGGAGGGNGGGGGGAAGGTAGGAFPLPPGVVSVWKAPNGLMRALTASGDGVVIAVDGQGVQYRRRIEADGGTGMTIPNNGPTAGLYQLGDALALCWNQGGVAGRVSWLDPQNLDLRLTQTLDLTVTACNVYPSPGGEGPIFAAWGTRDAGTELAVASGCPDAGCAGSFTAGYCGDGGSFQPWRIRFSPYLGDGVLTGQYSGDCSYLGSPLAPTPPPQSRGFIVRAPNVSGSLPESIESGGPPPVSERYGAAHYVAYRDAAGVKVGELSGMSNVLSTVGQLSAPPPREADELVSTLDAGLLLVGAERRGDFTADRDVLVVPVRPQSGAGTPWRFEVDGDQTVVAAAWVEPLRLLAVAGNCTSADGGFPASALCTGNGPSVFVVFVDPTRL